MSEKTVEVMFNIGVADAILMSNYKSRALKEYRAGMLDDWFYTLTVIRENINSDFNGKLKHYERDLDSLEKNIAELISNYKNSRRRKDFILSRIKLGDEVKKYQRILFDAMKELGYRPSKKDRTALGF